MTYHDILMTVLLESFYDGVIFMTITNNKYGNSAISVFNITCNVIYYTLQILYSLIMTYLKAITRKHWFPTRNRCCI
jgi:hypothetical protein